MSRYASQLVVFLLIVGLTRMLFSHDINEEAFIALLVGVYISYLVFDSFWIHSVPSPLDDLGFLRKVLTSAPNPIFVKDGKSRYLFANQATADLFGTTTAELIGKTDNELLSDQNEASNFQEDDREVLKSNSGKLIKEERLTDCNGVERWYQTLKLPFASRDGSETLVLGIALEITEQKRLEAQLTQAQKLEAIGRLAGGISHDFNNLLTAILGHVELIRILARDNEKIRDSAELAESAALRAADLTQRLLKFARKGKQEAVILDLNAVLDESLVILKRSFPANVRIEMRLKASFPYIMGDPVQIQQVIMNLAVNARDAMTPEYGKAKGGVLTISTSEETRSSLSGDEFPEPPVTGDRFLVLRFEDTGSGIEDSLTSKIFEPFFTTKGNGTGLGLSIVYGIVKDHNGVISVKSSRGSGTRFSLAFPLIDNIREVAPDSSTSATTLANSSGTILPYRAA